MVEKTDLDDSRHPVWVAVSEVATLEAVVAAVRAPSPEWEVAVLIERSVRVALTTVAQASVARVVEEAQADSIYDEFWRVFDGDAYRE